ncbi:Gfo/Idh/MocA family protein [Erysipelothrix urinaevulpis]|uniref:Gfo/Idh/MocA family protein n=1 Tax=Erysipelothrix urinaevulpis TaxID=2683717 RepID=UPI00135AA89A|nr:Gfo/Idh/MocA family oxidoreductase [Erysipelothrix urinaevulpis]
MKIGIMGLGNIAQKAYLPILNQMNEIDWIYHTRNKETLKILKSKYNWDCATSDFNIFMNSGLDAVMIHTPTSTHYQLIKLFLNRGIHVYVDKPVSESIEEVEELYALAKEKGVVLMVGFNRRYAPMYQKLKSIPGKNLLYLQKHRDNVVQDSTFALYDMMIHMVDLAVYLLDEEIVASIPHVRRDNNHLIYASLTLHTKNSSAFISINMQAGSRIETVELMSEEGHYRTENMDKLTVTQGNDVRIEQFGDWTPTLEKRGFSQIIQAFISNVEHQQTPNHLQSHQLVETLVKCKK